MRMEDFKSYAESIGLVWALNGASKIISLFDSETKKVVATINAEKECNFCIHHDMQYFKNKYYALKQITLFAMTTLEER